MSRGGWARTVAVGLLGSVLLSGVGGGASSPTLAVSNDPLLTVGVSPYRVLDTRNGIGAPAAAVGPQGVIDVQIAGVGPVPSNAVGVVLNLTGTRATEAGYVTAWPTGSERPTASVLNLTPGTDLPNMVTAALGDGGKLSLFNFTGSVDLIADVAAYLIPGSGAHGPSVQTLRLTGYDVMPNMYEGTIDKISTGQGGCITLTDARAWLSIPLVDGATITEVRVQGGDPTPSGSFVIEMYRVTESGADVLQGQADTGLAFTGTYSIAVPVGSPPAVSATARYHLYLRTSNNGGGPWQTFCGATVTYTLPAT